MRFAAGALTVAQALTAWFYPGQSEIKLMLGCPTSIAEAIAEGTGSHAEGELEGKRRVPTGATHLSSLKLPLAFICWFLEFHHQKRDIFCAFKFVSMELRQAFYSRA